MMMMNVFYDVTDESSLESSAPLFGSASVWEVNSLIESSIGDCFIDAPFDMGGEQLFSAQHSPPSEESSSADSLLTQALIEASFEMGGDKQICLVPKASSPDTLFQYMKMHKTCFVSQESSVEFLLQFLLHLPVSVGHSPVLSLPSCYDMLLKAIGGYPILQAYMLRLISTVAYVKNPQLLPLIPSAVDSSIDALIFLMQISSELLLAPEFSFMLQLASQ